MNWRRKMKAYETMRNRFIWRMKNHEKSGNLELIVLEPEEKPFDLKEWYGFFKWYGIDLMEIDYEPR